jgi:hypothetical protein
MLYPYRKKRREYEVCEENLNRRNQFEDLDHVKFSV